MKKLFMILPLVLVLCFAFGCQQGEEVAEELSDQKKKKLLGLLRKGLLIMLMQ
jgi:hypothetical protein